MAHRKKRHPRHNLWGAVGFSIIASILLPIPLHAAPAIDQQSQIDLGAQVYLENCGGCHGRFLQGQALWELRDEFSARRAPALDETTHAWRHSDAQLFNKIKNGYLTTPTKDRNYMPLFSSMLSDQEIRAVIAFLKSGWPVGMQVMQAQLNPKIDDTLKQKMKSAWRFPGNCPPSKSELSGTP